jgi:hypothetical protein
MKRRHSRSSSVSGRLSLSSDHNIEETENLEEEDEEEDETISLKRSNVIFNQSPSLSYLRNSQNDSGSQISSTPFDDLSEEAICSIFMALPPMVLSHRM